MKTNFAATIGAILFWSVLAFLILQPNIGLANPCGGVSRVLSIIVCFVLGFLLTAVSLKSEYDGVNRLLKQINDTGKDKK